MIEKNQNFPNALEALMLMVALMIVEYLVSAGMYDVRGFLGLDPRDVSGMVLIISNGILFTFLMEYKGMSYRELFHSSSSGGGMDWWMILPAIALTLPALVAVIASLVDLAVSIFPLSKSEQLMFSEMGSGSFGAILISCLLAPVLEEMLFRGIILRSFLQQYTKWAAILASATIFGVAHMNLYQFIVGVVMGIFLGWLYQRGKSLVPCIALHMAYNSTLTLLGLYGVGGFSDSLNAEQVFMFLTFLFLAARGMLLLRRVLPAAD